MSRVVILALVGLVFLSPTLGQSWLEIPEMKVKVYATPGQVQTFRQQVLEFYAATPEWFIGAVQKPVYEELLAKGYRVEVLVPDVRARAMEFDAYFHSYVYFRDTWGMIAAQYPNICRFDTIGTSAGGRLLVAMKITDNPDVMEGEPRICFDFSIHGNENNGCEIADHVMKQLLQNYGVDPLVTYLVNEREIWLIPMSNPDGLVSRSRYNDHGIDMNRDYGYAFDEGAGGGAVPFQETEVQAFYHLAEEYPMAAWSQYHSGTELAMQPWGYTTLATMDSIIHAYEMNRYGTICNYPSGQIARVLYSVNGGSTDWYYGARGALGYAIEVCDGQPSPPSQIDTINRANWTAMREQIVRVAWGIRGYVTDSVTGQPVAARIEVNPPGWFTYTDAIGFYHKNLRPGTYSVTAIANGYASRTISGIVVPADTYVVVNITLPPDSTAPVCAFKVNTCKIAQSPANSNPTNACWALGRRDSRRFSLGNGGFVTLDMGANTPIVNGPGYDFFVVEDDGDPEACSVFVSNNWLGPWRYVGFGTGTQGYDLSAAGQAIARFVRIRDDGNGGTGPYAGFDLDAVEAVVVNAPAIVYETKTVLDSPPGGNNDGKLDPGETAGLLVTLKNAGRVGLAALSAVLRTSDGFVSIQESIAQYGAMAPDSVRTNTASPFRIAAAPNTPREHSARMTIYLSGTDYEDSIGFEIVVGEIRPIDPIPDGPRTPALYWAYDDVDVGYSARPTYNWVEIANIGTRLTLSDDQTATVSLPSGFGPFRFYGQNYNQLAVCSNGWVGLGTTTSSAYTNTSLPNTSLPPMFCLYWDDLYPPTGGGVWYYHDATNHRFIVEYDSVPLYRNRTAFQKFQLILYDTTLAAGDGNCKAVVQYQIVSDLTSCTVGEQDPTRTIAIQCLFDGAYSRGCAAIEPNRAIKFATDDPTGVVVADQPEPGRSQRLWVNSNPVGGTIHIGYVLTRPERTQVAVYDNSGRRIRLLFEGQQSAGRHQLIWDGCDATGTRLAAGVYWLQLQNDSELSTTKVVFTR